MLVASAGLRAGTAIACLVIALTVAANPCLAIENVAFQSLDGSRINALLAKPASAAGRNPAVVMLHGCAGLFTKSGKLASRETAWIEILTKAGYVVLAPDSFGSRGHPGSLCAVRDRPVRPERERPKDAMGALQYLSQLPGIDPARIALMGWSNGAMTGLWTIGTDAAPGPGGADFKTAVLFYPGCIDVLKKRPDYVPRMPTLIQIGAIDDWTLPGPCGELVAAAAKRTPHRFEIVLYDGAYHAFDAPKSKVRTITTRNSSLKNGEKQVHVGTHPEAREAAILRALDWLKSYLGA